ncbi:MAG: hypothetical protein GC204_19225 [Chloroflexi bacterium]|nr:hypothetical protein [Chloroflexota bacterium]
MKEDYQIVADKWNELAGRKDKSTFTRVERMIWFLIILRVDLDMEGFSSIFIDSMSVTELLETITYLKELNLTNIAALLEQALALLKANDIYDADWNLIHWNLHESLHTEFNAIGDKIMNGDVLWDLDEKLAARLIQESDS